jgi:hypothetical protein
MKLSEELQQLSDSGDVGRAVEGLSEQAKVIEDLLKRHEKLRKLIMELNPFDPNFCTDDKYYSCDHCNPAKGYGHHTDDCPVTNLRETLLELGENDE